MAKTAIKVKTGEVVYTDISPEEVRQYLAGGAKGGSIYGWLEDDTGTKTGDIYISVHAIVYVIR